MKPETQHVASEIIQRAAENPKVGMAISGAAIGSGSGVVEPVIGLGANEIAVWVGIAVGIVSLYNQIMIAVRSRQKDKVTK